MARSRAPKCLMAPRAKRQVSSQFPPELVERGRALRGAFPRQGDRWIATEKSRWALEDIMAEVLRGVSKKDARYVKGAFAEKTLFDYLTIHHHSYTALAWPLERRHPDKSYHQHNERNKLARAAKTEADWAQIWEKPLRPDRSDVRLRETFLVADVLEQLRDPKFLKALKKAATNNGDAQGVDELERAARREWARVDRERQRLEKLEGDGAFDFYVQATARLTKLPFEIHAIRAMAPYMGPDFRKKLLKLADDAVIEVGKTIAAIKDIDKIEALQAKAASSTFDAEAATAQAHADRLANGRKGAQYGVRVNLHPDEQAQSKHSPTGLPSSSG
jgi:hypothetical protein